MKLKYIAIPALAFLASCSYMGRQTDSFMSWADRTMPTYDDNKPASGASSQSSGVIPNKYNGYPYNEGDARASMVEPGVSGATPPTPGYKSSAPGKVSNGMTPAQAASAGEGGNSRPLTSAKAPAPAVKKPPTGKTYVVTPAPAPSMVPSPPMAGSAVAQPTEGRRVPAGQLPPSAIQPVPYGQKAPAKSDDFPSEYKSSGQPGFDPMQDPMIPAPPI